MTLEKNKFTFVQFQCSFFSELNQECREMEKVLIFVRRKKNEKRYIINNLKNEKMEQKQMIVQWKMHNSNKDVSTEQRETKTTDHNHC